MDERICSIPGCGKPLNARGWCKGHYYRWSRYGDPLGAAPPEAFHRPKKPRKPCSVEGCENPHYGHGLCENHYARKRRHGGLHDERAQRTDPMTRFLARVDPCGPAPGEHPELGRCHVWQGPPNNSGYGSFNYPDRGPIGAHVAALLLAGIDPDGLDTHHRCHNAMCVRVEHLMPLDAFVNRGEVNRDKTHCPKGHPYDEVNTYWFRNGRKCRACHREYEIERYYRMKA